MKVSQLISALEAYKKIHGDDQVEFMAKANDDDDPDEYLLHEIHDGYTTDGGRQCEIRLRLDAA